MKKILISLLLISFLAVPVVVRGDLIDDWLGGGEPTVATEADQVFLTINSIITYLFWVLIFGAALVIAFSAYLFLTAAGDPDKTSKARNYVMYAIVAVVVGFLSKAIIALVARMLDVSIPLW